MDSEADDYEATGSEQEYDEDEREILNDLRKERKKKADQLKNQKLDVLSFSDSDDHEEDEDVVGNLMRDSDIEGAEDDDGDLPDTMDWGTNKKAYYNTDFVDPDYSSYTAQEEDMAKAEEEEAKKIQLRLAKQLTEADFKLDDVAVPVDDKDKDVTVKSITVTRDLKGLTERERLQLLQKDSPEFVGLTQDFQQHLSEVQQLTAPVLNYVRNHQVPMVPALQFALLYQNVLLTHCSNVSFYLLLKAKRSSIKYHPVVKRLVQLKQLREQLAPRYEEYIRPQLEALLERIQDGDAFTVLDPTQRKAKLQTVSKYNGTGTTNARIDKEPHDEDNTDGESDNEDADAIAVGDDDEDMDEEERMLEKALQEENERRGITYQMAKNKGLTPARKKELRNPRVKHRGKYRKALIRRKGAVRSVRKETKRYGGEISGIKATVTKSIKFKT
ncbi:PREDICTED: something about silencing protein 10 [Drosophila arizonae]|uniref:Something about silencing protein 10 n=1 Tax=Drosophila arizonae TaxID=7263 RepID=A0ABM1PSX1_DROAR|nr:PREDICTED: something about silencing protein 10 [Drosophila arizonae]